MLFISTLQLCFGYSEQTSDIHWPEFRGPNANGIIDGQKRGLPISWSEEKNVTWKTKIEGKAWSSPVIWKDQIWLTNSSANGKSMDAICINTNDGKIAYNLNLFKNETVEPLGNNVNSYGSPSPVIEEGMVYIHFGSYGTTALGILTVKNLESVQTDTFEDGHPNII